ncbi:MAG: ABC transporter permease [Ilumatobacteraceae bacterium]
MNKLIRAEWIKFRTSRSNWVLLAAGLILSVAIVVVSVALFGNSVGDSEPHVSLLDRANLIGFGSIMALIFISIVGVRVFGNEWRTGTIESAAIAAPIRAELFFAKCILMAIVGFVYGIAVSGIATLVVFIGLNGKDYSIGFDDPQVLRITLGYVVLCALYGLVGVTVGSFFTSNALATALVIAFPAVVEGALSAVLPGNAGSYLPFAAGNAVLNADPQISALEGGIIFAAFAAALILVGERVFDRRDLT